MYRYFPTPIFLLVALFSQSQSLEVGIMAGGSNYQGDLQEKYYDFNLMHPCFGANVTYNFNQNWAVRGEIWRGNLSGSDVTSDRAFASNRNLSFHTRIYEVGLAGIYRFSIKEYSRISPYLFGGLAVYRINPYTHGDPGQKIYLFPLSTEGQGLPQYPDKPNHKLYGLSIPLGAGLSWAVAPKWSIGLELGFRKTFTDYIDDVSDVYINEAFLQQERGAMAVEYAYRSDELPGGDPQFPSEGSHRGNPKASDLYYNTILRVQFRIFGETANKQKSRQQLDCPKNW